MIDASTFLSGRPYEKFYADPSPCPERVVFQIVGADEETLVKAAGQLATLDCTGIDLNMGCSAPFIFRQGAGIAWMKDPEKAGRLAERLRHAVGTKTLSMKLRLGEEEDEARLVTLGRRLQNAGADFLTLHPRTRQDSLQRPSRWHWVKVLREALSIPVVGNGDLTTFSGLLDRATQTPVDAWMVGRRAVTAPWTFRYWQGRWSDPTFDFEVDLKQVAEHFHRYLERYQPEDFWVTRSRRFYGYFCKNWQFGHRWGARLQHCRTYEEILREVSLFWEASPEDGIRLASSLE
jgi:tRNA-dihydrouridine synthase